MINLTNKHIVVTGASSGLGKAISILASELGARLSIMGRDKKRLDNTLDLLEGQEHQTFAIDITDFGSLENIVSKAVSAQGPIDGFVHSAGIEKTLPLRLTKPEVFKELMDVNLIAGFELARLISQKKSVNQSGASFVFISSIRGILGESGLTAYSASKAALLAASKAVAIELSSKNVRCNCILPGIVETEMVQKLFSSIPEDAKIKIINKHPLGIGKPQDVAYLACFLLSERARWITGAEFIIDGGYSAV
ncbi:MAG TPA: SDR family oxidoreductase [Bacteroidales bacterium]|nr:SDR family oxidoreductase [Bacteroidales bacterium]